MKACIIEKEEREEEREEGGRGGGRERSYTTIKLSFFSFFPLIVPLHY